MRAAACLLAAAAVLVPSWGHAAKNEPTLEEIREAVFDQWRGVRDLRVTDRATMVEYHRVAVLSVPHTYKEPIANTPNMWLMAPGLERLKLWQGGKSVDVSFDGYVTRWQGQRNAFGDRLGRIRTGNHMPVEDIGFSYYTGRMSRSLPLQDFLGMPETRLMKEKTVNEIPCYRIRGVCSMDFDGTAKLHEVIIDLAPQYGWLPVRTRIAEEESGNLVREYKARSFHTSSGFPFPKEAQVDLYVVTPPRDSRAKPRSFLASSLIYNVESVVVNGGLTPTDFALGFLDGTKVTDERTGESYVAGARGTPAR